MRLNCTGVAEGLPFNASNRKSHVVRASTEYFSFNYWNIGVDLGSIGKIWHLVSPMLKKQTSTCNVKLFYFMGTNIRGLKTMNMFVDI